MTSSQIGAKHLPPVSFFLNSVCPGNDFLDDNIHFSLSHVQDKIAEVSKLKWPLTGSQSIAHALLDPTYLNVARPPFKSPRHKNLESTTYVSLPLHVTHAFAQVVQQEGEAKQDGGLHIGANVNPLTHDPFKLVGMNPGCISAMIVLRPEAKSPMLNMETRSPFNKMANGINRFLRMGLSESGDSSQDHYMSILDSLTHTSTPSENGSTRIRKTHPIFAQLSDYDPKTYVSQLRSFAITKLLVSANVNVVNVFALDENYNYAGTSEILSETAIFPLTDLSAEPVQGKQPPVTSKCKPYQKVIEKPLLRLHLQEGIIVTSLLTLSDNPAVILGLNTGEVVIINLYTLKFRYFPSLTVPSVTDHRVQESSNYAVTALSTFAHPNHELLVVVGYATGEVIILDPSLPDPSSQYTKNVVGKDKFLTFFKLFDLSPFQQKDVLDSSPDYLIGHFKLSHKAITSITGTMPKQASNINPNKPMVLAIAADDGLVRFIDLISTHDKNYGDPSNFYHSSIVCDIVSCYFQDGIRCIEFSPDYRYFCLCGKGDIIEVFRMTYYNINGLLLRNANGASSHRGGRSRSGTVNSTGSGNHRAPSIFSNSTFSVNMETAKTEHSETVFPPSIKDIDIVSRLKGHTNTVDFVSFVHNEDLFHSDEGQSTGTYKLISCGNDGKIIIWDFDSKAFPRIKKPHVSSTRVRTSIHPENSHSPISKTLSPPAISKTHNRGPSWSLSNEEGGLNGSFSALGISNLLNPSSPPPALQVENSEDQRKIAFSLYRSLHDVRLKKHYAKSALNKDKNKKFTTIIHSIVNDKELPSIQVPLLTIDMSCLVKDGRLQGFHINPHNFWVFTRSGDIFRYTLENK
ncbi:putative catabolite repression protein [Clavispora lusitaniae]|uniref:Catabolite repression protein n=1 Tax=Clavispora lusitaniae TaxID=36911 RepID=A0ACD0WMX7_CLALS|nr:putative catabolite repression protein [Clavispora lusitaniae]QFZ34414.1 putative catabolite repression protein [Clavispora lusitaniae]QFZ40098.1 putative catabolite repression protein [Clavispora lusitaniae]QFZ45780.1 putative catabolite repression protein [Clavispora lusitaniae]QFZ51444.1 putative catabolite repression protein [Clavispora lusitaniae]